MFGRRQEYKLPEEDFILLTKPEENLTLSTESEKFEMEIVSDEADGLIVSSKGVVTRALEWVRDSIFWTVFYHIAFGVGWFLVYLYFVPFIFRLLLEGWVSADTIASLNTLASVVGSFGLAGSMLTLSVRVTYRLLYGVR